MISTFAFNGVTAAGMAGASATLRVPMWEHPAIAADGTTATARKRRAAAAIVASVGGLS